MLRQLCLPNDIFPIGILKNYSKLSGGNTKQGQNKGKKSLKISFLQEYTFNLVTDTDFELLTKSFINMDLGKTL